MLNRPSPLFQLELNERNLVLKPLYPIIEVPGKLNGTLNDLLQAELERVTFRMMVTKDSLAWLCDMISVYTTKLWEDGKVVILGPKWTTDHAKPEMIYVNGGGYDAPPREYPQEYMGEFNQQE